MLSRVKAVIKSPAEISAGLTDKKSLLIFLLNNIDQSFLVPITTIPSLAFSPYAADASAGL